MPTWITLLLTFMGGAMLGAGVSVVAIALLQINHKDNYDV